MKYDEYLKKFQNNTAQPAQETPTRADEVPGETAYQRYLRQTEGARRTEFSQKGNSLLTAYQDDYNAFIKTAQDDFKDNGQNTDKQKRNAGLLSAKQLQEKASLLRSYLSANKAFLSEEDMEKTLSFITDTGNQITKLRKLYSELNSQEQIVTQPVAPRSDTVVDVDGQATDTADKEAKVAELMEVGENFQMYTRKYNAIQNGLTTDFKPGYIPYEEGSTEYWQEYRKQEQAYNDFIQRKYEEYVRKYGSVEDVVAQVNALTGQTDERTWFQKGAYGEIDWKNKSVLENIGLLYKGAQATNADIAENLGAGLLEFGEKAADGLILASQYAAQGQYYQNGGVYQPIQQQKAAEESFDAGKKWAAGVVQKDLIEGEKIAKAATSALGIDTDADSVLGEKSDALVQSASQLAAQAGLNMVGVPWFLTSTASSFGGEAENALNEGASIDEAAMSGVITASAEILTERLSGITFGGKPVTDKLISKLTKGISNKFVKKLAEFGLGSVVFGEGTEEVLSEMIGRFGQWLTYQDDRTFQEMFLSEEAADAYIESYIGGFVLGEGNNIIKALSGSKRNTETGEETPHPSPAVTPSPQGEGYGGRIATGNDTGAGSNIYEDTLALVKNADKGTLDFAVAMYRQSGNVSNNQATAILNDPKAVQALQEQTGMELPGTAAGNRAAVKNAVVAFAQQEAASGVQTEDTTGDGSLPADSQTVPDVYQQVMAMAKGENVAQQQESKNIEPANANEQLGVKEQIRSQQDKLNAMQPVTEINVPAEFSQMDKASKQNSIVEKLRSTGYKVDRKGFGIIDFAKKRLKAAFKYFDNGSAEEAAFEALPYVLENGIEISSHSDHKGRAYRTVTIAAPVIINGKRGNMAVVVKQTDGNYYKVHRILTPDGAVFDLSETTNEADRADGGVTENGSLATSNGAASSEADVLGSTIGHRQTHSLIPASNNNIPETTPGVKPGDTTGSASDFFAQFQAMAKGEGTTQPQRNYANGTYQPQNAEVDTTPQTNYDNVNNQGGIADGTGQTAQADDLSRTAADSLTVRTEARTSDADRSGVQSDVGETRGRFKKIVPYRKDNGLNSTITSFDDDIITPKDGSPLAEAQNRFLVDYGIKCYIIRDSAWERNNPALAYDGDVYIRESINAETLTTAVPHESTHIMAQLDFAPYTEFLSRTSDSIQYGTQAGQDLLILAANHRGIDLFSMSDAQVYTLYGEANAIVYGMYKGGILESSEYGYEWIPGAFYDFDGYIKELDAIHEQFKQQRKSERSTPNTDSAVNHSRGADESVGAAPAGFDMNSHLQYEHGTIPEGENPVRPDDLPRKDINGKDVSHTARTVKGAQVTPDDFVDLLNNETVNGGLSYVKITNDATVQKAIDYITEEGWVAAKAKWQADVYNGKAGADMAATGALLLNNAAKAGDKAAWLDILHDYQILGTNTAQGLQALRILKKLTPSDKLYMAKRSVEQMVKDMKLDTEITIDPELEAEYNRAETDEQRDMVLRNIQKNVAQQLPTTFMEKFTALRYVNMLGNLRTQGRNFAGNITMMGVRAIHNAVATGIETVANKVSGGKVERTRSVILNKDQVRACAKDFDDMQEIVLEGSKFNDNDTATGFARGVQKEKQIFKFKPMEGYRKLTNWAMEQGDIIFAKDAYARALAGYLKAKGITETDLSKIDTAVMDDARLFAAKEAQEATFRDTNWLSGWISKIGRRKDTPVVGKMVSEGVMPFRKTPANVLIRAEEYSPLGIINSVVLSEKAVQKGSDITANQVINSWAKTLTGTGLFGLGMLLQSLGLLSAGPEDDEQTEDFEDLNGWQNYALTLPNGTNLTIDAFSPSAIPVLMGAQLMKETTQNGFQLKDIGDALLSIADPMVEMSMLQGVNDTLENIQYADSSLGQLVINTAVSYLTQGLTNTLAGQIERSFEDTRMQTYVDKDSELPDWLQRTIGKASAKMPGVDYSQIPYINAWGEVEENLPTELNLVYNLLSPSYIDKGKDDALTQELNRLNNAQGDINVYPKVPDKTVTWDKQQYNLSADEYVALAKLQGQTQKKLVEDIIANRDYDFLSDEDKAKAIRYAYDYARDSARGEVIEAHPGITTKWMAEIEGDVADAIIRYVATGTTEKYLDLSIPDAAYVVDIFKMIQPETGYENPRTIQKVETLAAADDQLTEAEQKTAMKDILDEDAYEKFSNILALGYDVDDYAASYRIYLDEKEDGGKGTKDRIIKEFRKEFGIGKSAATKLYECYVPPKD